ncbi:MAG: type II secretion system F family protein [Kiritimatiellae bacterium]|nr:type II secretion system F family protein [Kiritimatiellia bacterium]MBQ3099075.1 type II secretion system F family protein [Kiritimatiellia bacterium]
MSKLALEPFVVYGFVFAAVVAAVLVVVQTVKAAGGSPFLSWLGPRWIAKYRESQRKKAFGNRILDLTMGLANAMKAGMALAQALEKVSEQLGGVMREEISVVLREYRLGMGITDAMARLAERMPSEDMHLLTSAIRLTTQTGGSLVDVMEQLVDTIRNRTEFQQKLKTLTAQGKFEAMAMASAPLFAFVLLYFCQPDLMRPLVTTTTGWVAIGAVVVLEVAGFFVIRKIVTIEV